MTERATTADRIAEVALRLFAVHGYAGIAMDEVRREAGVSNGSLYHHYRSRAELAARLLVNGMTDCQRNIMEILARSDHAHQGICEVVHGHLTWMQEHRELARLLYSDLSDEVLVAAEPAFSEHNRSYVAAVGAWLSEQVDHGHLVQRPFELTHALWLGPAQEFTRHWLRGRSALTPEDAAAELAQGAWRALAAS
jgi:AcrR family transcriptional regulator